MVGGLVYSPAQPGRYLGLVFVHGTGTKDRTGFARSAAGGEVTVRYFDGAQHAIRIGDTTGPFAPGYLNTLAGWIDQMAEKRCRRGSRHRREQR